MIAFFGPIGDAHNLCFYGFFVMVLIVVGMMARHFAFSSQRPIRPSHRRTSANSARRVSARSGPRENGGPRNGPALDAFRAIHCNRPACRLQECQVPQSNRESAPLLLGSVEAIPPSLAIAHEIPGGFGSEFASVFNRVESRFREFSPSRFTLAVAHANPRHDLTFNHRSAVTRITIAPVKTSLRRTITHHSRPKFVIQNVRHRPWV
jgi:hypothetical protein